MGDICPPAATAVWWPMLPINIAIGGFVQQKQGMASVGSLTVAALLILINPPI